jgi:hypothetical protein
MAERAREEFEVKDLTRFVTYETNEGEQISSLFAWRSGRERNSKSRIAFQATAEGGDHFVVVLEFEFLSRIIASMQSMTYCRCSLRRIG